MKSYFKGANAPLERFHSAENDDIENSGLYGRQESKSCIGEARYWIENMVRAALGQTRKGMSDRRD